MNLFIALSLAASTTLAQTADEEPAPVRVTIESDSPKVELYRISGASMGQVVSGGASAMMGVTHIERECRAPCGKRVLQPDDDFFIGGQGVPISDQFSLLGHGEDVTLKVRAGSGGMLYGGGTLVTLGAIGLLTGGIILGVEAISAGSRSPSTTPLVPGEVFWAGVIGSGVLLGGGITLIAFGGTDVEFLPKPSPESPRKGERL